MVKIRSHEELDKILSLEADNLEGFKDRCAEIAAEWDSKNWALDIVDPGTWRRPVEEGDEASRVSLAQQFRADVDSIETMDRESEARLARRIEFARVRLEQALAREGMTSENLVGTTLQYTPGSVAADCSLPPQVCRRWLELHAMRVEMVERNLYLVLINVERYSHTTAAQSDLIQEGAAALFRAVDGFDWRRGLLFRTYAVHWLNQAFRSYLYNFSNTVRVPVYLQKALKHINDAKARLGDANADPAKIAKETDLAENLVSTAISAARSSRSIDLAFDDEGEGGRLKDLLKDEVDDPYTTDLEDVTLEGSLTGALAQLSDRERYVVEQRFGLNGESEKTLAQVAGVLGVSLERVRQIQVRALNKLRTPGLRRQIDPFLN